MGRIGSLRTSSIVALGIFATLAEVHAHDAWDRAATSDNTAFATRNYLNGPGASNSQIHDLEAFGGVADEDWYIYYVEEDRSYSVTVTNTTGDVDSSAADFLQRRSVDGVTLLQGQGGLDNYRYLRWTSLHSGWERIRVKGQANTGANSQYTIFAQESTYYCPRFNNSGTQVSVLILQNATDFGCQLGATFHDESGSVLTKVSTPLGSNGVKVLGLSSIPALVGTKGGVRITHDCNARAFKGKVVALEPATGFSFDTACEHPHN